MFLTKKLSTEKSQTGLPKSPWCISQQGPSCIEARVSYNQNSFKEQSKALWSWRILNIQHRFYTSQRLILSSLNNSKCKPSREQGDYDRTTNKILPCHISLPKPNLQIYHLWNRMREQNKTHKQIHIQRINLNDEVIPKGGPPEFRMNPNTSLQTKGKSG